jgi:hypothetical protein
MAENADHLAVPGGPDPHGGGSHPEQRNAYVGPQPFPPDRVLYGRDRELLALTNRLTSERLVLLYSPSGAGKTSLIQAKGGLRQRMAAEGFHVLPVIRVGLFADVAAKADVNRYLLSTLSALVQESPEPDRPSPEELAEELRRGGPEGGQMVLNEHLARLTPRADRQGVAPILLVFDQFEELLTLDPTDEATKRAFLRPLGAVLRDRDRWALFAMREDYVSALDPYLPLLPGRLSATFRLDLLGTRAAATAIREPAREQGVTIEESVVDQVVEQLALTRVLNPVDGTTQEKPGPHVEPVQLQVVCQMLWQQRRQPDRITATDLASLRLEGGDAGDGVTSALRLYYDRTVERVARQWQGMGQAGVFERAIRDWFEHALISERDLRLPMLLGEEKKYGLEPGVLVDLADAYLIRSDRRSGGVWYELAHDRLVTPIRRSNQAWRRQKLSPFQQAAELWNESARKKDLLVGGEVLAEGERLQSGSSGLWSRTDADFLEACRAAERERKRAEQEAIKAQLEAKRRKLWLQGVILLSVGIISMFLGLAILAEVQRRKAEEATHKAEEATRETEKTLAAGLWRPIGRQDGSLNVVEVSALTELGSLTKEHDSARMKFVEMALANSASSQRFARRTAAAIQAAVGLNRDLAERVRGTVQPQLADQSAGPEVKTAAALALAELQLGDVATATAAAAVLLEGLNKVTAGRESRNLAGALEKVMRRLPEALQAELRDKAAKLLLDALDKEKVVDAGNLVSALGEVAKGLPENRKPELFSKAAKPLLDALKKEENSVARQRLASALAEVSKRLPEPQKTELLDTAANLLLDIFDKDKSADARYWLASALNEVTKGLRPEKAVKLLFEAVKKEENPYGRFLLAWDLREVAKGLSETPKIALLDNAAKLLLSALDNEKASVPRSWLASALGEVAKGLPPDRGARLLLDVLEKETNAEPRLRLASALGELAKGLPPDKALKLLLDAVDKANDPRAPRPLASTLAEIAKGPSEPRKTELLDKLANLLLDALGKETSSNARPLLASALGEVTKGLPPEKAVKLLLVAREKETDADGGLRLASALADVAKDLTEPRKAELLDKAARLLLDSLDNAKDVYVGAKLTEELAKVSFEAGSPKGTLLLFQALARHGDVNSCFCDTLEHMAAQMDLQVAVDLLKQPLCYDEARQVLLRRVEQLTGQTFPTRWDMVDYLRRHRPDIDLDSPPKPPDQ